ncbi:UAA transporter [Tulasnella sp. 403]|nr:UAA transporter [Tulasnella sp. 403]
MLAAPSLPSIYEHDDSNSSRKHLHDHMATSYWTPVNFPPSPAFTASSPSSTTPSSPPSPSTSPPPPSYDSSVALEQQSAVVNPLPLVTHLIPHLQQSESRPTSYSMPVGQDSLRHHTPQRPPIPRKPTPLRVATSPHPPPVKSFTSYGSGFVWIGLYFIFNMGLTLYNKTVLVHFPFPYTLTALHTFCGTVGCMWLRQTGYFTPARLTPRQNVTLALFSVLYTLNIAVSNISLQLVTVPFHQVVRATAPVFTILVAYLLGASREKGILGVGKTKLLSLFPVVAGVGFATYGDYSFTAWGFILTLFGTFLAALKTVLTSILQTPPAVSRTGTPLPTTTPVKTAPGYEFLVPPSSASAASSAGSNSPPKSPSFHQSLLTAKLNAQRLGQQTGGWFSRPFDFLSSRLGKRFSFITKRFDLDFGLQQQSMMSTSIKLHPLDLLLRMSPLAFVQCIVYAWLSGELERALVHKGPGEFGWSQKSAIVLFMNGVIAFLLNIVSLTANQKNGPLTMTVAANVKQVLTILLAMFIFNLSINPANSVGIILTLAGGAWYGALEYQEKKDRLTKL